MGEISDKHVSQLIILTQTPPAPRKLHTAAGKDDRTGDWTTRVKITQELSKAINDGLRYYEYDLWSQREVPFLSSSFHPPPTLPPFSRTGPHGRPRWAP